MFAQLFALLFKLIPPDLSSLMQKKTTYPFSVLYDLYS